MSKQPIKQAIYGVPNHIAPIIFQFINTESLAISLVNRLVEKIHISIAQRGTFHMVFPGGFSPRRILEILSEQDLPWTKLHLYPSDERCVPPGDPERNDHLIEKYLLTKVPLPLENLHRIPAELGPEKAARHFSNLLEKNPNFDIAILGIGLDGHIASLFPGNPALQDIHHAVPVYNSPKPPTHRVSIGINRLQAAHERWIIVVGKEKWNLIKRFIHDMGSPMMRVKPTAFYVEDILMPKRES